MIRVLPLITSAEFHSACNHSCRRPVKWPVCYPVLEGDFHVKALVAIAGILFGCCFWQKALFSQLKERGCHPTPSFHLISFQTESQSQKDYDRLMPADGIRQRVEGIKPGEIANLQFRGIQFGFDAGTPFRELKDRGLIGQFLDALQHAYESELQAEDQGDLLEINFKNRHRRSLWFNFNVNNIGESFGPEFHQVLLAWGQYEAEQVHKRVQAVATQVREINFHRSDKIKATAPEEIQALLRSLQQVGPRAFDFTNSYFYPCILQLVLRHGRPIQIYFIIGRYKNDLPSENGAFALPELLLKYCMQNEKKASESR